MIKTFSFRKLVLLLISIFILSIAIYIGYLYYSIQQSKTKGFSNTEEKVLEQTDVTKVESIYRFNGEQSYHIIFGKTKDGTQKIVYVPLTKDNNEFTIIEQNEVLSEEEVKSYWYQDCQQCEFIKITPAMVDNKPLWEITYIDEKDRYVFDYLSLYDGSHYEQFRLHTKLH